MFEIILIQKREPNVHSYCFILDVGWVYVSLACSSMCNSNALVVVTRRVLDNVKKLRQYILQYTAGNSLTL